MAQITMNRRSFLAAAAATALVPTAAAFAEEAPTGGDYDIVVVGMGGAGMCAALAASEAGVEKIVILEKNAMEGGNTIFASSGMNASETSYQKDQDIEDSTDLFIQETIAGGHNWNNVELVTQMCEGSAAAIDWLANREEDYDADFPVRFDVISLFLVNRERALLRYHVNALGVC